MSEIYLQFENEVTRAAYDSSTNTLYLDNGSYLAYYPVGSGLGYLVLTGDRNALVQAQASAVAKPVVRLPKGVSWVTLPLKTITMYEVNSSNVELIGYDEETSTLYVKFHSGDMYEYDNVPQQIWNGLRDADSKGSYVHWFLKINDSDYTYRKVSVPYTIGAPLVNRGTKHPSGYMNM